MCFCFCLHHPALSDPEVHGNLCRRSPRMTSSRQYCSGPHSQLPVTSLKNMLKWIRRISRVAPFSSEIWSSMIRALSKTQLHYRLVSVKLLDWVKQWAKKPCLVWSHVTEPPMMNLYIRCKRACIHLNIASILLKLITFLIMYVVRSVKCGKEVKMAPLCHFLSLFSRLWKLEEGDEREVKLAVRCTASSGGGLCMLV